MIVNCAQFARATGWPLATVRRWCNQGIIRHVRLGRVMLFDDADAKKAIQQLQELPPVMYYPTATPGRKSRSPTTCAGYSLPPPDGKGVDRLRELLKNKRACPAATGQAQ